MKTSWKTTVCGILSSLGAILVSFKDPAWVSAVGTIMLALGSAGVGLAARDSNVTSEQAGLKPEQISPKN